MFDSEVQKLVDSGEIELDQIEALVEEQNQKEDKEESE